MTGYEGEHSHHVPVILIHEVVLSPSEDLIPRHNDMTRRDPALE